MTTALSILSELHKRLRYVLAFFVSLFVGCFFCSDVIFHWYMLPLQHLLRAPQHLVATQITSPVIIPLSMAGQLALLGTTPVGLWQIWSLVSPALYRQERQALGWIVIVSVGLFGVGCLACYRFILPGMFRCMLNALPKEVLLLPDIYSVTRFSTHMLILFGLSFQIPLICFLLLRMHIVQIKQCSAFRPYVIVAAFTLGMLLTPPDVIAQILLALPLWGLYEVGLLVARVLNKAIR